MKIQFDILMSIPIFSIFVSLGPFVAQAQELSRNDTTLSELGAGFISNTVKVNQTTIHYVRGGKGPVVILVHGFPQDWYEFRKIMPRLSKNFTVIAVDLRV
ncbi:hypothetical protein SAMN05421821_102124 [Mucilaginibacter lappiensis]|uniref:AB hydrolase-1 domain-containing protein n=1 Tax=Mucilaginibacter lappiensis TaxID=354630 RepID=A0ABR6PFV1_9SPHI|nr:alpha/beta fold hydrolase [Mucilaginibacter lappiensis]MBB6108641.1 hypothetical protein [Mucilaginibacter lappiensis]SIQ29716.1 hypothetical protein SAMN05421821_102124 [Mucilaginibacter lappiensis]